MKSLVLDFDGVVVDSEAHWPAVENKVFHNILPAWDESEHHTFLGLSFKDMYTILVETYNLDLNRDDFEQIVEQMATLVYQQSKLIPGIKEVIAQAESAALDISIASSSRHEWINGIIERYLPDQHFDAIVTSQDIPLGKGKPNPDIFLKVAEVLQSNPNDCIVIEDSDNGVAGAKDAGMHCIGFKNGMSENQHFTRADSIVFNLNEIDLTAIA